MASDHSDTAAPVLDLAAQVQFTDDEPLHEQITRWLGALISDGLLNSGDRIPAERDLSAALGVSRMTLRQAISTLDQQGRLRQVRGRNGGTFVTQPSIEVDLTSLPGFAHQIRSANQHASSVVVSSETTSASGELSAMLGVTPGSVIYKVVRIRKANDLPIAFEESYFPAAALPGFLEQDLADSLYDLLQSYGQRPIKAQEYLTPVVASREEAHHLGVAEGTPLLRIARTAYSSTDEIVELSFDLFRADIVKIGVLSRFDAPSQASTRELAR